MKMSRNKWFADFISSATPADLVVLEELMRVAPGFVDQGTWEQNPERISLESAEQAFRLALTADEWEDYSSRARGWIATGAQPEQRRFSAEINRTWARKWVCKRAHDLGWSEQLHAEFDSSAAINLERMTHTVERIGKKYQWIALFDLRAYLTENCAFIGRAGGRRGLVYPGEIDGGARDFDPSLLLRDLVEGGGSDSGPPTWWAPHLQSVARNRRNYCDGLR